MAEDRPLLRQWTLIKTLAVRPLTLKQLAAECGVSEKTARRDLVLLCELGFPLEEAIGPFGRKTWRIASTWNEPQRCFTFDEAVALYLGRRLMDPLVGTAFWQAAQNAFKKVRASLRDSTVRHLDKMADNFYQTAVGAHDYRDKYDVIDNLWLAVEERRVVLLSYQSERATEPVEYEVHPYGLIFHRHTLYLVAHSCDHQAIRTFKIDRLSEVEVTNFKFERPNDFRLASHLEGSFGVYSGHGDVRVTVWFLPPVVRYVGEGQWHASQRLEAQSDGSLLAYFRLSSTEEIKRWIFSFGRNAVVLEPDALRAEVTRELEAMSLAYHAKKPPPSKAIAHRKLTKHKPG